MANKKTLSIKDVPPVTQSNSEKFAIASLSANTMSAVLSDSFTTNVFPGMAISDVADLLSDKITSVQSGDTKHLEAMLVGQAQALQTMFVSLGRMATNKTQLAQYTAFMNLALKAQSQSRATIQALVELKYPKHATFVKQANIAHGHQQVNNGINQNSKPTHARENQHQPNELLEGENNGSEELDIRATTTTGRENKAMATMAKVNRSTDDRG